MEEDGAKSPSARTDSVSGASSATAKYAAAFKVAALQRRLSWHVPLAEMN